MKQLRTKPTAVVLSGGVAHRELIRLLKKRGYRTVLVDYTTAPPAAKEADVFAQVSAFDPDAVYQVARAEKADMVIASNQAIANTVAVEVAGRLGLYVPYTGETARLIDSKRRMKDVLIAHNIPTARYVALSREEPFPETLPRFPVVVKPSNSYGSRGVRRADNMEEAKAFIHEALQVSRDGEAIVEEYCEGHEISVYCFVTNGKAHVILTNQRYVDSKEMMRGYAMVYPAACGKNVEAALPSIAEKIAEAFHLNTTPLYIQAVANGDSVHVLEFALRIGGGFSYRNVEKLTGFPYLSATIDAFEGKIPDLSWHECSGFSSTNHIYVTRSAVIGRYIVDDSLIRRKIVDQIIFNRKEGEEAPAVSSTTGRVVTFLTSAETYSEMLRKISFAMSHIDILDSNGVSIMRKDLYIRESAST